MKFTLKPSRRLLIALIPVLLLGFYFFKRSEGFGPLSSVVSKVDPTPVGVDSESSVNALLKHSTQRGEVKTFRVQQELSVELNPAQGQAILTRMQVRGQFDEQLLSVEQNTLTYQYRFRDMNFESTDAQGKSAIEPAEMANIAQSLNSAVVILNTDRQRSTLHWSVSKTASLETLNLLRSLLLSSSLFLPNSSELSEWSGTEEDQTGSFALMHRLVSLADGKAVIEKEPRAVRVELDNDSQSSAAGQSVVILPASVTKIEFDAQAGHVLTSDQRWALRAQAAGLDATTQLRTFIEYVGKRATSSADGSASAAASAVDASEYATEHALRAAHSLSLRKKIAAQKLAGETWGSLRNRFQSSEFHKDGAARAQFFEQLSALMYLQPDICTNVTNEIAQLDKNDPDYKSKLSLLAGVFTMQDSPEAEASLAVLVERLKDDSGALMQVIPALAAHRNPSERTRDVLYKTYESASDEGVLSTATLALGTFASRAKSARPDLSRETIERLKQDFDSAPSVEKKVTLSGALGNVGARETIESVKNLFAVSQDESMKRSALYDLRFVDDPGADSILQDMVRNPATDPDLVVQSVRVMRMRPPLKSHLESSLQLFRDTKARPTVRSEALYTIAYLSPVAPDEVRKTLESAVRDPNAQVAKQAEQLLAKQAQSQAQ